MSDLIKISEAATMGIHAMAYLAAKVERLVPLNEVAERLAVSENHLSKVFQRLGRGDLVKSTRGPAGGYTLARNPEDITLLEVYEAIDGILKPKHCLFSKSVCVAECCGLGELVGRQNQEAKEYLARTNLSQVTRIFEKRNKK